MTKLQEKIIKVYEQTKQTKEVTLPLRQIAKKVGCSLALAQRTIKKYQQEHEDNSRRR